MPHEIYSPLDTDDTASTCCRLLERHGPRLMREGGGHLTEERLKSGTAISEETKARIIALRRQHLTYRQIAAACEITISPITKILSEAGLTDRTRNFHHAKAA